MQPAEELRRVRRCAGFSQRELAGRTGVAQPTIARIENGSASPRVDTFNRLVAACGAEWRIVSVRPAVELSDWAQVQDNLRLSSQERIEKMLGWAKTIQEIRRAGREARARGRVPS